MEPVGNACNALCTYCYASSGQNVRVMSQDLLEKVFTEAAELGDRFGMGVLFTWHGGEPLLAGQEFYENVVDLQASVFGKRVENRMQTNGTLLTDDFARFLREEKFHVGFSVDGPEHVHNAHRKYPDGRGTFSDTMRGVLLWKEVTGKEPSAVAVVTRKTLEHVKEVVDFFEETFSSVRLNPVEPCGRGIRVAGPSEDEMKQFYIDVLTHRQWHTRFEPIDELLLALFHGAEISLCSLKQQCAFLMNIAVKVDGTITACPSGSVPPLVFGHVSDGLFDAAFFSDARADLLHRYAVLSSAPCDCPLSDRCPRGRGCPAHAFCTAGTIMDSAPTCDVFARFLNDVVSNPSLSEIARRVSVFL